ncbi:MBL fold metallo-hydrolase [Mesorhizobium sp. M4B.F.Ca.ET.169.01.1.1]|uniref:MBL fold metallo-hydrolase n=1 Tax=Mesorhizobium sp. M4B.F.Ca.ET.169.01.1.1 TaxID=2563949 RepID=UPI001FDF13F7|nr:MBL fold metallo-hydrolase [Mesorhizobium sp. M4B.F.Ca.ET.169.01.1.1]
MLSTSAAARGSFEFDCIDADFADGVEGVITQAFTEPVTKPFAVVRIVTTPRRLEELAGGPGLPGNWFSLEIGPKGSAASMPTWHAQLQLNGFPSHSRGVTSNITYIESDEGGGPARPRPQSIGAAVADQVTVPSAIIAACALPSATNTLQAIAGILSSVAKVTTLRIKDVGQASFSSPCDKYGKTLLHYDVGFPISFNGHTSPKKFDIDPAEKPVVVLSHWDWDHLHAAFLHPHLMECVWIVPEQKLGPGAARLAHILAAKGGLLIHSTGVSTVFPSGEIAHANGPQGNLNNTGLTVQVELESGRFALLTGDVDYRFLTHSGVRPINHLIATHHGARFDSGSAAIPAPVSGSGKLLLSYGGHNVYRHPHPEALKLHAGAGWVNQVPTARYGALPRGDREVN